MDNSVNVATCLTFIAAAQERLGNFKESLKTFQKAENIANANSDLLQKGMIYNQLRLVLKISLLYVKERSDMI